MYHSGQNGFSTTSDQGYLRNSSSGVRHGGLSTRHTEPSSWQKEHTGTVPVYLTIALNPTYGGYTGVQEDGTSTTLKHWENLSNTLVGKEGETGI